MWKQLKETTNSSKITTPTSIIHNGETINKAIDIANLANQYFIDKIINIRDKFGQNNIDPLYYIKKLFKKNDNEFSIPILTIKETEQLIKKAKNSWTVCSDEISMNIIKKLNKKISPHLTHLYNTMTRTAIYPEIIKLNKILPTLKPDKDKFLMESYRPINI